MPKIHTRMRIFGHPAMSILVGLAIGCAREDAAATGANKAKEEQRPSPNANEPGSKIARSKAIKAAEAHLRGQGHLSKPYDVDATAKEDGEWNVTFWSKPPVPGGFTTVVVDKNDTILRVEPGK